MLIDASHVVEHGMRTYKGLPAPLICDFLSREQSRSIYAPATEFQIGKVAVVANTATYLDSPGWVKRGQQFIRMGNLLLRTLCKSTMGSKTRNRGPGKRLSGKVRLSHFANELLFCPLSGSTPADVTVGQETLQRSQLRMGGQP